jgi:HK97 family phage portal protein
MAILDLFRPRRNRASNTPVKRWTAQQWRDIFSIVGGTEGGTRINSAEASFANIGTVFRCVSVLRDAGTIRPQLVDAADEPVNNAKFDEWVNEPFNSMTWEHWLGLILGHIALSGGARLVVTDTENPLWYMPYSLNVCVVSFESGRTYPPSSYRIGTNHYERDRVIEVMPSDPTSLFDAVAPAEASLLAAKTAYQTDRHSSDTLENGATIAAVLMLKQAMPPEQFAEWMTKFRGQAKDTKNSGVIVLDGAEAELHKFGMSLADLRLPELGNMAREEIATAMGVPPALLGDSEARYANFKEQRVTFLEDTLRPRWRLIEGALSQRLVPLFGRGLRLKLVESDSYIARLLWDESAQRIGPIAGMVVTVNEARARLGLADIGPEGDVLWRPFTAMPYKVRPAISPGRALPVDTARAVLSYVRMTRRKDINNRSDAMRAIYWRGFDKLAARFDSENDGTYTAKWRKLFGATTAALQDSARENWEKSGTIPYSREQFDTAQMRVRMAVLPAVWREGMDMAAGQIADITGRARKPDVIRGLAEDIMAKLRARAEHWGAITGDGTFTAVDGLIATGTTEGWTLQQMLDALEAEAMLSPVRAERIARTEVLGTLNEAALDTYAGSGEVAAKEWLAIQDDRTRDEHIEADGQTVGLADGFIVGSETLQFPGDPSGSPGNIINCRCTVLPVLTPAQEE